MVLSDQLVILFCMIFYVLLERAMDVRPYYWDSLKIGNQLWIRIVMWQLFWWIFRKLLIICHMTFFSVNWLLMDCHSNLPISKILENYLRGRKEQIKRQGVVSGWQILQKGVPQGSIMGSLLFNIFYKKYFLLYWTWYIVQLCWWQHLIICRSRLLYLNKCFRKWKLYFNFMV